LCFLQAQQIPAFEESLTVYFEDGIGNKDSVLLHFNFSEDCTNTNFDTIEQVLTTPFDSVLK